MSEKIFLILGASSDLGQALVQKLNQDNNDCLFCLHCHSGEEALRSLPLSNGNSLHILQADLSEDDQVQALIDELKAEDIIPTHIVNLCGAKMQFTKLKDFDKERTDRNVNIQVYSFVRILQAFLPAMAKRKDNNKVVAVISSVVNGKPPKFLIEYTLVKSMLLGAVKQLASDYEGKKININAISPSMINTKFLSEVDEKLIEMSAMSSPEGRNAEVEDIVPAICFLLSQDSNYLNGVNLNVSNGSIII